MESIVLIQRASHEGNSQERVSRVQSIIEHMNELLTYVRIANELNQFGKKEAYFYLSEKIIEIINQAENWKRFLQRK